MVCSAINALCTGVMPSSSVRFAGTCLKPKLTLNSTKEDYGSLLHKLQLALVTGLIHGGALRPIDISADATSDVTEHYWFPMLAGLSDLTSDPRPEVRNCALEVLFDFLYERGSKFSSSFWENISHRVLFLVFEENLISSGDEWPRESTIHSLQLLFNTFYQEVCFMLPPLLSLLLDCAKKADQSVVSLSPGALVNPIEVGGHQFSINDWETLLKSISGPESDAGPAKEETRSDQHIGEASDSNVQPVTGASIISALANTGHTFGEAEAELVLNQLRLAFETKNPKVLELALDCLQKLIACDHLDGDPGLDGGKNGQLFGDILTMVCGCVDNSSPDSTTLQVLKALLTAVASNKFRVHGEPLLGVFRVCYNIALNSNSPINQATAKAMLTQMLNIVIRRMESDQSTQVLSIVIRRMESDQSTQVTASSTIIANKESSSESESNLEVEKSLPSDQNGTETTLGNEAPINQNQVNETSLTSVEDLKNLVGGSDIKGLEAVLEKAVNLEVNLEEGEEVTRGIDVEVMRTGERDALLVFRTLCKMGMKEENDEVTTKTQVLSHELLQGLLEGVGVSFIKNFNFIDSVKAYLSNAHYCGQRFLSLITYFSMLQEFSHYSCCSSGRVSKGKLVSFFP